MIRREIKETNPSKIINYLGIKLPKEVKDFPGGSDGKASACNAGDPGSIPGSGRSPEEGMAARASILAWSKWAPGLRYFVSCLFVSVVWSGMTGFCQFARQCGMHTIRGDYCLFIPSAARLDFR